MTDENFPIEDEIVLATVDRILGTAVFVKLDKYGKEGVINFSEVAPGRIRNIMDYVQPGRKIVVKVLRVDKEKGHIDLSLRRVSAKEKKEILEMHEHEKEAMILIKLAVKDKVRAENIIEKIGKAKPLADFLSEIQELAENPGKGIEILVGFGFGKDEAGGFMDKIAERAKQKMVVVKTEISVSSDAEDGIERIKKVLSTGEINYISAPKYLLTIKDKNYKDANRKIKELVDAMSARAKELECSFEVKK